jgi:hypothetical protein
MKGTTYGNRLPRGTQVKNVLEPLVKASKPSPSIIRITPYELTYRPIILILQYSIRSVYYDYYYYYYYYYYYLENSPFKLTGSQTGKKFPGLYGTQFITTLTSARHLSLT